MTRPGTWMTEWAHPVIQAGLDDGGPGPTPSSRLRQRYERREKMKKRSYKKGKVRLRLHRHPYYKILVVQTWDCPGSQMCIGIWKMLR